MRVPVAFKAACDLFIARGFTRLNQHPEPTALDVNESWRITINPHGDERAGIPPYHILVECCGLVAGLLAPNGGTVIGDTEGELIAALEGAREKEGE